MRAAEATFAGGLSPMRKPRVGTGQKAAIKVPAYKKGRTVHSCPDMQASQAEPQSQQRLGFPFAPSRCPEALIAGTWDTVGRRCGGGNLRPILVLAYRARLEPSVMATIEELQEQAKFCLRLSQQPSMSKVKDGLLAIAAAYLEQANNLRAQSKHRRAKKKHKHPPMHNSGAFLHR